MDVALLTDIVILALLAATGLGIAALRQLFPVALLAGIYSLLSACFFVLMDAVDVAFTEAAVGAGMVTVLFLATFALTSKTELPTRPRRRIAALLIVGLTGALLMLASLDMPHFADPQAPIHQHPVYERYVVESGKEIAVPNIVTSVLASYRGYDTLGEVTVIFTAGIAVWMLLAGRLRKTPPEEDAS